MEVIKEIEMCYHTCPFFNIYHPSQVMSCKHPFFDGKPDSASRIITVANSHGRVPDECPLEYDYLVMIVKLKSKE